VFVTRRIDIETIILLPTGVALLGSPEHAVNEGLELRGQPMLTKLVQISVVMALMTSAGQAADVETTAAYDWSGSYIGAFGGVAWSDADIDGKIFNDGGVPAHPQFLLDVVNAINDSSHSNVTGTYGVQAGYNLQLDMVVLGVQVDFGGLNLGDSDQRVEDLGEGLVVSVENSFDTDWMLTLRPRIGLVFDNLLLYATGGAALTDLTFKHDYATTEPGAISAEDFSETSSQWGWIAGAGLEYAADDHWSIAIEYLYADFGTVSEERRVIFTDAAIAEPLNTVFKNELDLVVQTVRASVNYKF